MRKTMLAVASHAGPVANGNPLSDGHAISALAALAQPTRLAIFRLLIKHEPIGITAGVIADTVGAPHNTLSSHLAILVRARLLRSSRDGRTIVYRSDVDGMQSLLSFLVNDCCNGHPELCNLSGFPAGSRGFRLLRARPCESRRAQKTGFVRAFEEARPIGPTEFPAHRSHQNRAVTPMSRKAWHVLFQQTCTFFDGRGFS